MRSCGVGKGAPETYGPWEQRLRQRYQGRRLWRRRRRRRRRHERSGRRAEFFALSKHPSGRRGVSERGEQRAEARGCGERHHVVMVVVFNDKSKRDTRCVQSGWVLQHSRRVLSVCTEAVSRPSSTSLRRPRRHSPPSSLSRGSHQRDLSHPTAAPQARGGIALAIGSPHVRKTSACAPPSSAADIPPRYCPLRVSRTTNAASGPPRNNGANSALNHQIAASSKSR